MKKINKILIANRSEIAVRVIRACREMGIACVAVYSDADATSLHTLMADESVHIGPAPASQSYLNMDTIIQAAIDTHCDAIHPGYGFLAEKHEFCRKVQAAGLIFIGPDPEPMKLLGSKLDSRQVMIRAGVPVIAGMDASSGGNVDFSAEAQKIGYPVLIKSSDGGGGKGMRVVRRPDGLLESLEAARRESLSAFGSDRVYLEKYLASPRHIEFQVAADRHGNVVHLFERECSIQRRHQKIIEESPSVALDDELRTRMGQTAVNVIKASNYNSIGTVEFLLAPDNSFYFLEVNARIQVEHPVTEMTTGVDLVKLQIEIAMGAPLAPSLGTIAQRGHAIECRIYAEDASNNFMPSGGKILLLREPSGPGIRYDSGIYEGCEVPVYYDPVLAKLIAWGATREEARRRLVLALRENVILGVNTSIAYMAHILEHEQFIAGNTFTDFIDLHMSGRTGPSDEFFEAALVATAYADSRPGTDLNDNQSSEIPSPWLSLGAWEIAGK